MSDVAVYPERAASVESEVVVRQSVRNSKHQGQQLWRQIHDLKFRKILKLAPLAISRIGSVAILVTAEAIQYFGE
jgi:hypothetical protein